MAEPRRPNLDISNISASTDLRDEAITDWRHIAMGWEIPTETYSDQPKIVKTDDGAWLCCMTTGAGREGAGGQHVITTRSTDSGATWSTPIDVEPSDGPEASYACLLKVPSGRVYCFYNHNTDNIRELKKDPEGLRGYEGPEPYPDGTVRRVDSFGHFVFKYSDDNGLSWSEKRYEVPVREMEIDRTNVYGGDIRFFWNVSSPFIYDGTAYVSLHKVGGFGPGFFVRNEGVLLASSNILSEADPTKLEWQTLPDGEIGLRTPPGGGPISSEHAYVPLSDGSLYSVYRTIDGYPACAYSRDRGHTWSEPQYAHYAQGRKIKNPRAANFVWKAGEKRYLYWFHNHGGPLVPQLMKYNAGYPYENRNPVWLCAGVETDGPDGPVIAWSEPEIVLYDDDPFIRMSYPDLVIEDGTFYLAETQKDKARVHPIDPGFLDLFWTQFERSDVATDGLILQLPASNRTDAAVPEVVENPAYGRFLERDHRRPDYGAKDLRAGFTLDLVVTLDSDAPDQILLDTRTPDGRGVALTTAGGGAIRLSLCDGQTTSVWASDSGSVVAGERRHVSVIVDGGPKVIVFVIDGVVNDGGDERQFGWGRFSPVLKSARGGDELRIGADGFSGTIHSLRLYDRALMVTEAIGNWRALSSSVAGA